MAKTQGRIKGQEEGRKLPYEWPEHRGLIRPRPNETGQGKEILFSDARKGKSKERQAAYKEGSPLKGGGGRDEECTPIKTGNREYL